MWLCLGGSREAFFRWHARLWFRRVRIKKMSHLRLAGDVPVDLFFQLMISFCQPLMLT
jgi:hypothetical protein